MGARQIANVRALTAVQPRRDRYVERDARRFQKRFSPTRLCRVQVFARKFPVSLVSMIRDYIRYGTQTRLTGDVDLGDRLYANHILRDMGTRHLSDGESRGVSRGPEILYLIAVSHAAVLPTGMLLVKSHQNGVKTIYILPYGDRLFSWVLLG